MQIDWFTFAAQIVNFLILLVLLRKFLYRPILNVMKKRADEVSSRLEEARIKLEEAEQKSVTYQEKLEQIDQEKKELLLEAKRETESYKKELLQAARSEVEKVRKKWMQTVDAEKKDFLKKVERQSFSKIIETVEKIIGDLANRELEQQALEKFIEKAKRIDASEIKRIAQSSSEQGEGVEIITAFPLSESEREKLNKIAVDLFQNGKECKFEVSPKLGFGIEIRSGGWKMGWNMKTYLDELRTQVNDFLNRNPAVIDN